MAQEQQPEALDNEKTEAPEEEKTEILEENKPEVVEEDKPESADKGEESEVPQNIVTIEDAGPCKKKVVIEIPEEAIKKATDEQYGELHKDAQIPGFRKGRAPRRLLEKRFGKEVSEQVKMKLLADASEAAVKDNELQTLGEPDIDFENTELPAEGPLRFDFEIEVRPEFDLPVLEGIPVTKTKLEVADEQIEREVEQMRRLAGVWTPRGEADTIEAEDQIIADVILKVEGIEEDEKLDNTEIYVRANGFVGAIPVEKLDELLVGAKAGETRETSIEVPKTFFREEYRGKKVDVKIDVKDVKWLKPGELDENLFKQIGVEDEDELREKIQDTLQGRLEQQSRTEMTEQIYKYLLDNTDFELPLDIVGEQATMVLQRQYSNLIMRGLSREQLDEQLEQLQAGSEQQAEQQLKTFFIMDKVAEKLDISVSEEEINGNIAQLAMQRGQRPEKMREQMARDGSLAQFSLEVRQNKCIAKLLETAQVTEKKAKKAKKSKKKTDKPAKKTTKKPKATEPEEKEKS
ncbi:MAG TPA: trigger factor [Phycisphaerales bacterium]|nr:trigger factor [Phycisphaerales bacterium]